MQLPIEAVVELLMANRIGDTIVLNGRIVYCDDIGDLRGCIRTYLETLAEVPHEQAD